MQLLGQRIHITIRLMDVKSGTFEKDDYPNQDRIEIVKRLDSRGDLNFTAGFLFAVGKTFKSGKMNIPLNLFFIPGTSGARFGISFGWNGKERFETM